MSQGLVGLTALCGVRSSKNPTVGRSCQYGLVYHTVVLGLEMSRGWPADRPIGLSGVSVSARIWRRILLREIRENKVNHGSGLFAHIYPVSQRARLEQTPSKGYWRLVRRISQGYMLAGLWTSIQFVTRMAVQKDSKHALSCKHREPYLQQAYSYNIVATLTAPSEGNAHQTGTAWGTVMKKLQLPYRLHQIHWTSDTALGTPKEKLGCGR